MLPLKLGGFVIHTSMLKNVFVHYDHKCGNDISV